MRETAIVPAAAFGPMESFTREPRKPPIERLISSSTLMIRFRAFTGNATAPAIYGVFLGNLEKS
jgi:hypothetical protein